MATQYSPILKLALPVEGELTGTWGDVVNDNITSMVEEAIAGRKVINTWTSNSHTLTSADGLTAESRAAMLELTDTGTALTGAGTVICPANSKLFVVKNTTGQTVTIKTSAGTGVPVYNNTTMFVECDGTNVIESITNINTLHIDGTEVTATATELNTLDGITASTAELNHTDGVTSNIQTQLDAMVEKAGDTMTGDLSLGDNVKAKFGASDDLQIYHDGSNSFIKDTGDGILFVQGSGGVRVLGSDTSENLARFNENGSVQLYHDNAEKLATTSTGVTVTGEVVSDGLSLGDSVKAKFGAGDDLQIYHDSATGHSYIKESGSGDLILQAGNDLRLEDPNGNEYLRGNEGAGVDIAYNNATKLATTSTGVDVTGTVTADGLTVDGTIASPSTLRISNTGGSWSVGDELGRIQFYSDDSSGIGKHEAASIRAVTNQGGVQTDGTLEFWRSPYNSNVIKALEIDGVTGDFHLFEDTGTTAKFVWDSSAESLGIGTSTPSGLLTLNNASGAAQLYIKSGNSNDSSIIFGAQDDAATGSISYFHSDNSLRLNGYNNTERMRIDSSGRVGIGTSSPVEKLYVNSTSGDARIGLNAPTGSDTEIKFSNNGTVEYSIGHDDATDNFVIGTTNVDAGLVSVTKSGNVGIGTSSPSSPLHVKGGSTTTSTNTADFIANSTARLVTNHANEYGAYIGYVNSSNDAVSIISARSNGVGGPLSLNTFGGNVGIGTSSPAQKLDVVGSGDTFFKLGNGSYNTYIGTESTGTRVGNDDNKPIRFLTNADEKARIDSSGNLLVGKTSANSNLEGCELRSAFAVFTSDANVSAIYNRKTSDGTIQEFQKDGSTVGSIGTYLGDLTVGNEDTGLLYHNADNAIKPWHVTANLARNGVTSLGDADHRFKDLYLSGGVQLGVGNNLSWGGTYSSGSPTIAATSNTLNFYPTGNSLGEAMRLDSSGNLLVSKSSVNTSAVGIELRESGKGMFTASGTDPVFINRLSSDGEILKFAKDNAIVGSIGVKDGSRLRVEGSSSLSGFVAFGAGIGIGSSTADDKPTTTIQSASDNSASISTSHYLYTSQSEWQPFYIFIKVASGRIGLQAQHSAWYLYKGQSYNENTAGIALVDSGGNTSDIAISISDEDAGGYECRLKVTATSSGMDRITMTTEVGAYCTQTYSKRI